MSTPPAVFIDGAATNKLDLSFMREEDALGTSHVVELRYENLVVASMSVGILANGGCVMPPSAGITLSYAQAICELDSGDLRDGDDQSETVVPGGLEGCTGDSFCEPQCGCTPDERCTAHFVSMSPPFSHMGCAPIGTKAAGDACAFTPDPAGAYDDCGKDLVCISGTCQSSSCVGGSYVPGYPPEIRICN